MTRDLIIAVFEDCMQQFEKRVLQDLKQVQYEMFLGYQELIETLRAENRIMREKLDEAKRVLAAIEHRQQALFNETQRDFAERLQ